MILGEVLLWAKSVFFLLRGMCLRLILLILSSTLHHIFQLTKNLMNIIVNVYDTYYKLVSSVYDTFVLGIWRTFERFVVSITMLGYVGRRILWCLVWLLRLVIQPLVFFTGLGKKLRCPPATNHLLFYSATKLAAMIREQKVTSEDVIRAYVARCREVNSVLNAIVEPRFEMAIKEAQNVDNFIKTSGKNVADLSKDFPLLGVPITVKESIAVEGMSNEAGRVRATRTPATADAAVVRRARQAGAVPLLVSSTPELCMNWETCNYVTGRTRNPHDTARTPGGSSGGEAALISSAASLIGLGSDIAGSLRLPAMFTGIYGHKPTPHLVSTEGHVPGCIDSRWDDHFALGPMARYAEDLPLLLDVIKEPNGPQVDVKKKVDIQKIRFYYMDLQQDGLTDKLSPDITDAIQKMEDYLRKTYNIEVKKINIKNMEYMFEISVRIILDMEGIENIYSKPGSPKEWVSIWPEVLKKIFGCSNSILFAVLFGPLKKFCNILPQSQLDEMRKMAGEIKKDLLETLGDDGILIIPTFPVTAQKHYQMFYQPLNTTYLTMFNCLGLPATNVPLGLAPSSRPAGLQLVAGPGHDHLTFNVAAELERAFGGWTPPSSSPQLTPHNHKESEVVSLHIK